MTGMSPLRGRVVAEFERQFGEPPEFVARAPGRVNLIGDHTDFNRLCPADAIARAVDRVAVERGRPVRVHSRDFRAANSIRRLPSIRDGASAQDVQIHCGSRGRSGAGLPRALKAWCR